MNNCLKEEEFTFLREKLAELNGDHRLYSLDYLTVDVQPF